MFFCPGWWHGTGMAAGKVKAELLFTKASHSRRHSVQVLGGKSKHSSCRGGCGSRQHQLSFKRDWAGPLVDGEGE